MYKSFPFAALFTVFLAFWLAVPAQAESGLYVSGELGMNFGESLDVDGSDNDRESVCDQYINPEFESLMGGTDEPDCTAPRTGDTFQSHFSSDEGILFGTALGYRMRDSRFRVELEYFYRDTGYDDEYHAPVGASGADDKSRDEIQVAKERIGSLASHNLFANLYIDFANNSRFTPYVGFGVGLGFTDLGYGAVFQRNIDEDAIKTGTGLSNEAAVKEKLAGTATTEHEELDDTLFGYQVLFGVDYALTESLLLGVKGRWVSFDSFKDGDEWDTLRSHPSNLRLDGSEPVKYNLKVDDIEMFAVSMNLKYQLGGDPVPVQAASGFYVSGELGMNFGSSLDTNGSTNDRASVCDEYINPDYAAIMDDGQGNSCTAPIRGEGDGWKNDFSSDEGILFGTALGYRIRDSRFRAELEYFYRGTGYDETSDVPSAAGVNQDKIAQEIVTATDRIGGLTSHNLFANLYMDFENDSRFTPYVGFGVGLGFTDVDYGSVWQRNLNPCAIATGATSGSCGPDTTNTGINPTVIQQNLAGTTSVVDTELDDTLFGYQVLFGVDYTLTESVLLGVKGRWVSFESFRDDGIVWNPLRSHSPYLRKPGAQDREFVEGDFKVDDIEMFAVSLNLKYRF